MLESSPRQQNRAFSFCPLGFSVCLDLSISLSLSGPFLKSALKKKKKSSLYSVNWRHTFGLHRPPLSLLTYASIIVCLLCLMSVSPFQHQLSIKHTTVLPLPLGSTVSFNYFLTVFIASSLVVLSCSCHLWPHSPPTLLVNYFYS